MKVVKNNWIPFDGFGYMTLYWWIFTRNGSKTTILPKTYNHESIHLIQIYGIWIISTLVLVPLAACGVISWWWLLTIIPSYYILYFVLWVLEILLPPYTTAYKDNPFEREAKANEYDFNYCTFKHWFTWPAYFLIKRW